MLQISGLRLPLSATEQDALEAARKRVGLSASSVVSGGVSKISVDARHGKVCFVYGVLLTLQPGLDESKFIGVPGVSVRQTKPLIIGRGSKAAGRPVVCGLGPAGLFAALLLAKQGARPIVLERGPAIEERAAKVERFNLTGELDENANIQFGEGGAGTFSDGKLVTRIGDERCDYVTEVLLQHGAPQEIALRAKPHIGTDELRGVITSIRKEIEALGGEIHFNTRLTGLLTANGRLTGVATTAGDIATEVLVLAVGHSARDVFEFLPRYEVKMAAKPFSVGFRVEHLQREVDRALYHEAAGHPALPPGEYQLSTHVGDRGVYTFCMCPGGQVVAAASEAEHLCTNGMSYHARDGENANAAVVVGVLDSDFNGDPAKAIAFQRELEARAYKVHGGYVAPAENVPSFLRGEGQLCVGSVRPTYPRGVAATDLGSLLPNHLTSALREGLARFEKKQTGFCAPDAILTGLETRTSSPVRIARRADTCSETIEGLYPCGEGAGYAGGIVSAAVDGLRVAQNILETYSFS